MRRVRQPDVRRRAVGRLRPQARRTSTSAAAPAGSPRRSPRPSASSAATPRRLHYLSVPPWAADDVVRTLGQAGLAERSRIIVEKPFGTDLAQRQGAQRGAALDVHRGADLPHRPLPRQGSGAEHPGLPVRQRAVRADLEPRPHRPRADRRPRDARRSAMRAGFYEATGAYRDMVVTHLFQVLAFMAMEPPAALGTAGDRRGEEQGVPLDATDRARPRRARPVRRLPRRTGRRHRSRTPRRSSPCAARSTTGGGPACRSSCAPGSSMAEGARIISIAFREPPRSMFPAGSGVGALGPDHLTFDLADAAKLSLSFYGKRPGTGHEARQAEPAVLAPRDRPAGRRARGLRAPDPRRDERRPHAVQQLRGHRAALGAVHAVAGVRRRRCGPTRRGRGDRTPSTS